MPFQLIWTNRSKKDLKQIETPIASRIIDKLDALGKKDFVFLDKVKGTDYYKFRVGDYRVLIDKFPATKKLFIMKVRHRKKFYKNL